MKIGIWYEVSGVLGGGNQFLRTLAKELTQRGHIVKSSPADNDIVLVNAFLKGPGKHLSPGEVAQLRLTGKVSPWAKFLHPFIWRFGLRNGPTIVHRLDGVSELIRGIPTKADRVHPAVNRLSDYTIFQSIYSKESFSWYHVNPKNNSIIYNGVDGDIFFPSKDPPSCNDATLNLVAISWSPNIRKGFAILSAASRIPGVDVRFIGRWCDAVDPSNVKLMGVMQSHELAQIMRNSDAMIHAAENEPCSNAIMEALACGLPVLYLDSGGNRELAGEFGVAISDNLENDVERLRADLSVLRDKVHTSRADFLIGPVAERYVQAFELALQLRGL